MKTVLLKVAIEENENSTDFLILAIALSLTSPQQFRLAHALAQSCTLLSDCLVLAK